MTSLLIVWFRTTAHQSVLIEISFTDFKEFVTLVVLLHYLSITETTRFSVLGYQLDTYTDDEHTGSGLAAVDCLLTLGFT
jgi:hypothetical protein